MARIVRTFLLVLLLTVGLLAGNASTTVEAANSARGKPRSCGSRTRRRARSQHLARSRAESGIEITAGPSLSWSLTGNLRQVTLPKHGSAEPADRGKARTDAQRAADRPGRHPEFT